MNKKYEFTDDVKNVYAPESCTPVKVTRIRRLSDGLLGGYIEKEDNLSHQGNCFVYDDAVVMGGATVRGDATVKGDAMVYECARVFNNATVEDYALVYGEADICKNATVKGQAEIKDRAIVFENAVVMDNALISGYTRIHGDAVIGGNMDLYDAWVDEKCITVQTHTITTIDYNVSMTILETEDGYKFKLEGITIDDADEVESIIYDRYGEVDNESMQKIEESVEKLLSVYK